MNRAAIVEVAALSYRQNIMGYNKADEKYSRLIRIQVSSSTLVISY